MRLFESRIVREFNHRQKKITEQLTLSEKFRNKRKIAESRELADYVLLLQQELGLFFEHYRDLLVRHGITPLYRVGIQPLTPDEMRTIERFSSTPGMYLGKR
ncbi:MAG: hypothetical protein HQ505_04725 [Nitrosopumilus sp.]|nr:hypothetical protein [Nitrosopumilus sp.]